MGDQTWVFVLAFVTLGLVLVVAAVSLARTRKAQRTHEHSAMSSPEQRD
jgi:hypothetical protein